MNRKKKKKKKEKNWFSSVNNFFGTSVMEWSRISQLFQVK